jgi:hypothetical protein
VAARLSSSSKRAAGTRLPFCPRDGSLLTSPTSRAYHPGAAGLSGAETPPSVPQNKKQYPERTGGFAPSPAWLSPQFQRDLSLCRAAWTGSARAAHRHRAAGRRASRGR